MLDRRGKVRVMDFGLAGLAALADAIAADNHIVRTARNRVLPSATRS